MRNEHGEPNRIELSCTEWRKANNSSSLLANYEQPLIECSEMHAQKANSYRILTSFQFQYEINFPNGTRKQ